MNFKSKTIFQNISKYFSEIPDFGLRTAKKFNGHDSVYDQMDIMINKIKNIENYRENNNLEIDDSEKEELSLLLSMIKNKILDKMNFFKYATFEHNKSISNDSSLPSSLQIDSKNPNSNQIFNEFDLSHNKEISNIELITKIMNWSNKAAKSCTALKDDAIKSNPRGYNSLKFNLMKKSFKVPNKKVLCDDLFLDNYHNKLLENIPEDEIYDDEKYNFFSDLTDEEEYSSLDNVIEEYKKKFNPKENDETLNFLINYNESNKITTLKDDFINTYTLYSNKQISEKTFKESLSYKYINSLIGKNSEKYKNIDLDNLYQLITYENITSQMYDIKNNMISIFFKEYARLKENHQDKGIDVSFHKNSKSSNDIYNTVLTVSFPDYFDNFSVHFDNNFRNSPSLRKGFKDNPVLSSIPYVTRKRTPIPSILNFKLNEHQINDLQLRNRNMRNYTNDEVGDFYNPRLDTLKRKGVPYETR